MRPQFSLATSTVADQSPSFIWSTRFEFRLKLRQAEQALPADVPVSTIADDR